MVFSLVYDNKMTQAAYHRLSSHKSSGYKENFIFQGSRTEPETQPTRTSCDVTWVTTLPGASAWWGLEGPSHGPSNRTKTQTHRNLYPVSYDSISVSTTITVVSGFLRVHTTSDCSPQSTWIHDEPVLNLYEPKGSPMDPQGPLLNVHVPLNYDITHLKTSYSPSPIPLRSSIQRTETRFCVV